MNILNIEHISKIFGEKLIFDDVSYGIQEGDKIGIIGINGTGKTTLLKIIAGLEEGDQGEVIAQNGLKIGFLPQNPEFPQGTSVLSCVMEGKKRKDWNTESEARSILNRLGITEHEVQIDHLSGGQKKRAALARTLLEPADVFILDEPTNHLDNEMAAWLEEYLEKFKGVVLMVTHDRYFLDRVTNKILEISHGKLYGYEANYSKFLELKAAREEMELASERKRKSLLRMELEWAKRGCRARSTKQRARLERLETLKNTGMPASAQKVEMDTAETRMGKKTIELSLVSKQYGDKVLMRNFSYTVLKNQRLGIIGPNGCGKSTLMKILAGVEEPDSGTVETGGTIKIGYFAQEEPDMDTDQRVIDYIRNISEYVTTSEGKISASQMLERFLFDAAMQYTPVSKLSGGEKRRLYLLSILIKGNNVLLMDEPTNNLDIPTLTILEDFLDSFSGIVITVSHDRYFLDSVVDRIFAFEGDGRLQQYEGGFTDYLLARERRMAQENAGGGTRKENRTNKEPQEKEWKQNCPVRLKFTFKEQREYEIIDEEIEALEDTVAMLDREMMQHATNPVKLSEITVEKERAEQELDKKMERWVYLNELSDKIEAQKSS